jgi:hypothetical protein
MTSSVGGPPINPFDYTVLNGVTRAERASQWGFRADRYLMTDVAMSALQGYESELRR